MVAKLLCKKVNPQSTADNIGVYRQEIMTAFPQVAQFEVEARRFELTMHPWEEWANGQSPFWWRAYTDVKHQRDTQFRQANLKNMLNAVAGLFVACLFLYKELAELPGLTPTPEMLGAAPKHLTGIRPIGVDVYRLQ